MVVGAFPAAKLGALLLKQISKPIANALKEQAKNSPIFRKYVCMPPAQFYNWCEVKTKMWVLNLGKPVNVPVLSEAMAIELGANLLGEGVIFLVAAGLLINEYTRSSRKEAAKEEAKKQELLQLHYTLQELYFTMEKQGAQIRELMRNISDLESRVVQKPWVPKKDHPDKPQGGGEEGPPPPPGAQFIQPDLNLEEFQYDDVEDDLGDRSDTQNEGTKEKSKSSLLLAAVNDVENNFFSTEKESREAGIIMKALNHIYKDVYRLPLTV